MKLIFISLLVSLLTTSCQYQQPDKLRMVSVDELQQAMKANDVFLVDVHTPQQAHIKGTDKFIPYDQVAQNAGQLPADKTTPIYLYCEAGPMGNAAARALQELGYTNLYNLEGGADAWRRAGLPFE